MNLIRGVNMNRKPNILLITSDQQRYDSINPYGCRCIDTSAFNRLEREGIVFEHCYANNPICTPSRCSMLTGLELPGHGVYRLHDNLPLDQELFTVCLQQEGYKTALFGKLHICGMFREAEQRHPADGFDIYEWCHDPALHLDSPYNAYTQWLRSNHSAFYKRLEKEGRRTTDFPADATFTHWAAERTIEFIRNEAREPFFCYMSLFDPHNPYFDCPNEYVEQVDVQAIPPIISHKDDIGNAPRGLERERAKYRDGYPNVIRDRRQYFGAVKMMDYELGRVLNALDEKGIAENTIVVFLSDHGDMLGDHGLGTKGAFFYEAGIHIPLIIRWPSVVPKGLREDALVQPHDIAATLLSAAGVSSAEIKNRMPATANLLSIKEEKRKYVFSAYRNSGYGDTNTYFDPPLHADMVRDERFKLILYANEPEPESAGQLFDLINDPDEHVNLFADPAYTGVRQRLIQTLYDWHIRNDALYCGSRGGESRTEASRV